MRRYYFDLIENGREFIDDEGDDLTNNAQASNCARGVLADHARNLLRRSLEGELVVRVRDIKGPLFSAKLSLTFG